MKNIFLLLLLFTGIAKAQIVTIPDVNFKLKLFALGVDTNSDSEIQLSEALATTTLSVHSSNIASLTGIEAFTNLTYLNCGTNQISTLNVNNLTNLQTLICSYNNLSSLNINNLTNLQILYCQSNQLTQLDVTNLLDIHELYCSNNQLTSVDTAVLQNLELLNCSGNLMTYVDVSNNPLLCSLFCANMPSLNRINLKNGLSNFSCLNNSVLYQNPNLQNVCADAGEVLFLQNYFINNSMPNVNVNPYCTFVPGGNYNTISGSMTYDSNNNGCDINDFAKPNIKVKISDGTIQSETFTNTSGNYTFFTQAGILTLTPEIENPTWFTISPTNPTITFANNNNNSITQNFCITANGVHPDVEIVLVPMGGARPGFDANYQLVYKNKGNQTLSGAVNLAFDDAVTDFVSAMPTVGSQVTNSLTWNYTNLLPFETRTINFTLNVNSPLETPAVNSGDILTFTVTINPIAGDEMPLDNTFDLRQISVNSFDPNDKTCLEGNTLSPQKIGDYLHYNINFENTGSADAINIVVKDVIDATKFEINTLQVMSASHDVRTEIKGNVVEFVFKNIYLASNPGGHGNVLFKIKTKSNLVNGDIVSNTANIFFDYNSPIVTNEARTTFATLSNPAFEIDNSVLVYPNPTKNNINISAKNNLKSVQLFDIQGRILQTVLENKNTTTIDVSNNQTGIYFLKITTEDGCKIERVIKE